MTTQTLEFALSSPEGTTALAQRIAPVLTAGDVLLLEGDIGAGKTHFARGLIQSLLVEPEDVPSPTFTLIQVYETQNFDIWHADLYRLSSPDEVVELGMTEAFEEAVCLVEWPDRLAELSPKTALKIRLQMSKETGVRNIEISADSARWSKLLHDLSHD